MRLARSIGRERLPNPEIVFAELLAVRFVQGREQVVVDDHTVEVHGLLGVLYAAGDGRRGAAGHGRPCAAAGLRETLDCGGGPRAFDALRPVCQGAHSERVVFSASAATREQQSEQQRARSWGNLHARRLALFGNTELMRQSATLGGLFNFD